MPLADFYSTVHVAGENPVEYWIRLNKAVDAAEEGLKRQGRHIGDPRREVTMMFVKYCPDPSLAAVLRFKAPDKWTASEIQEHVDRYQIELKEKSLTKPNRFTSARPVAAHVQTAAADVSTSASCSVPPPVPVEFSATTHPQIDDNCIKTLIGLLDRTLAQNNQATVVRQHSSDQFQKKFCKVCKSVEHSTLAHCRHERLCLSCFKPGHIKRNCPNNHFRQEHLATNSPREQQPLN